MWNSAPYLGVEERMDQEAVWDDDAELFGRAHGQLAELEQEEH